MKLSIQLSGLAETRTIFQARLANATDMSPAYRAIGELIIDKARARILQGGSPPWKPTAFPSNLHPMLRKTGTLLNALNPGSMVIKSNGVSVGQGLPSYAGIQQEGAAHLGSRLSKAARKRPSISTGGGIAARPFLYLDSEDRVSIRQLIKNYILTGALPL